MASQRRRRVRPIRKPSAQPIRRRRPQKRRVDWKDSMIKSFIVLFLIFDVVLVVIIIRQCSMPIEVEEVVQEETLPLQIEVLNGCGVTGIANQFTEYLRGQGFDVVKTDNYESFNVIKTVVIDRRGSKKNGLKVAQALGMGEERVLQEVNEAYLLDATVILGMDFRQLDCWEMMEK